MLNTLLKGREDENYRALPANTSQEVLKLINQNFCSFFKTLSMKRERLMTNKVSIPKYLDSIKGRQVLIYNQMTIGKVLLKKGIIQLPKTKIQIKTNQNFVQIPFEKLVQLISYKAKLQGIQVFLREESYTSQVSFLEGYYIPTFKKDDSKKNPSGKRIKRGLYSSPKGLLNADINGSLNILRKFLASNNKDFNSPVGKSHVDWPVRIKNPQRIKTLMIV